jgi:NADPH:quinone reductase-like Zn-dependent oxidoreductase
LTFPEAAAVPLTSITSWEMLFHRLAIPEAASGATVLIIGGTGGVGSMAVQLARQLTNLTVVTTSFADAKELEWCRRHGADHVINHLEPIAAQITALKTPPVKYVFSTNMTGHHYPQIAELIAPQGRFGLIDDPEPLDLRLLKVKKRLRALGEHVYPIDVSDRRHGGSASSPDAPIADDRRGPNQYDSCRSTRPDQRRQFSRRA